MPAVRSGVPNYHDMPLWHSLIVEKIDEEITATTAETLKLHVLLGQAAFILLTCRATLG
jgi:hypothetical protein